MTLKKCSTIEIILDYNENQHIRETYLDHCCIIILHFVKSPNLEEDLLYRLTEKHFIFDKLSIYLVPVFSMPIIVFRGHQIHINDETTASSFDLVFTISRPMARYAFFGSIYMTIVITFERYCGKNLIFNALCNY